MFEKNVIQYLKNEFNPKDVKSLIGDDAAVIANAVKSKNVITIDTLCEGYHFFKETKAENIGKKVTNVSISDIASMGASPKYILISLSIPKSKNINWVKSFYSGVKNACKPYKVKLIGGDTTRNKVVTVSSVLIGETFLDKPIFRSDAKQGEYIYATGYFGRSLELKHHIHFTPRVKEIKWLLKRIKISSMTDVSDGLIKAIELITTDNNKSAEIFLKTIKLRKDSKNKQSSIENALYDGEDFELLFTSKKICPQVLQSFKEKFNIPLTEIGKITSNKKTGINFLFEGKKMHFSKKNKLREKFEF